MPISRSALLTIIAAAISAYASWLVVHHATPIDRALPFIAIVIGVVAAMTSETILMAIPLLMAAEIAIADERMRLISFGLVIGVAFAASLLIKARELTFAQAATIAVAAILILRWIPLHEVHFGREIFLLIIAIGIVAAYGSTPFAVAIAVAVTLLTSAIPLRTLLFPMAVLVIGAVLQLAGMLPLRADVTGASLTCLMLIFFAWSGAFARAWPIVVRGVKSTERVPVRISLAANQSAELDVPHEATALILSGANVPRLKRGTMLGRIDPGNIPVRIGDVSDWGVLRREHFYSSHNPRPRDPAGLLRDYGYAAWIDGAGRLPLPRSRKVRITADPALAPNARLQIDAFELEGR